MEPSELNSDAWRIIFLVYTEMRKRSEQKTDIELQDLFTKEVAKSEWRKVELLKAIFDELDSFVKRMEGTFAHRDLKEVWEGERRYREIKNALDRNDNPDMDRGFWKELIDKYAARRPTNFLFPGKKNKSIPIIPESLTIFQRMRDAVLVLLRLEEELEAS